MKQTFNVQGMSCGHCVTMVTQAVKSVDPRAEVAVDLPTGRVDVQSDGDRSAITKAIEEEGYKVAA